MLCYLFVAFLVKVHEYLLEHGELPHKQYKSRLAEEIAFDMLNWIKSVCLLGWKPYSLRTYILESNACKFNKLQRTDSIRSICDIFKEYQKACDVTAGKTVDDSASTTEQPVAKFKPGRDTLRTFLKYVTERTRSQSCLSTFYVRFCDSFAMHERLITQCQKGQENALQLFDERYDCVHKQENIRTKLVRPQAYMAKIKEYRTILKFAKYDLRSHLHVEHEGCQCVSLQCVLQGLYGCDTMKDHSKQCRDCNKLLRSAHDLRLWMRNAIMICAKPSSFCCQSGAQVNLHFIRGVEGVETGPEPVSFVGTGVEVVESMDADVALQCEEDIDVAVQCEQCHKWFTLPPEICPEDLPEVFKCTLRWWDFCTDKSYGKNDWCRQGRTNSKLVKQWVNILQARSVEAMVTTTAEHDMTDVLTSKIVKHAASIPEASMLLSEESDVTE